MLNDAVSIYSADAMLASAFIARWCVGAKVETAGGVFQVHKDQPEPRVGAGLHRTARSPYSTRLKRHALSGELTLNRVFASEPPDSSQHRGRYLQFFLTTNYQ